MFHFRYFKYSDRLHLRSFTPKSFTPTDGSFKYYRSYTPTQNLECYFYATKIMRRQIWPKVKNTEHIRRAIYQNKSIIYSIFNTKSMNLTMSYFHHNYIRTGILNGFPL